MRQSVSYYCFMNEIQYTIGELAELAGITRRAVRYYVQRGLIPPPLGGGRGHYYTGLHLEGLRRVRSLQEAGYSLQEAGAILAGQSGDGPADAPAITVEDQPSSLWVRIPVSSGVELHVQTGRFRLSPARLSRLARAAGELLDEYLLPLSGDEEP